MGSSPDSASPPDGNRSATASSKTGEATEDDSGISGNKSARRPLRIGLWEPGVTEIQAELEAAMSEGEVWIVGPDSNPLEIHAVDCLVADCSGIDAQAASVYETIRGTYPKKPLVVVTRGTNEAQREQIADSEYTAHVPRTEAGLPVPLVIARCKRLAKRPLSETESDEPEVRSPTTTQTLSLWLLWGVAVLTYGVGDFVTTIIAVYFVQGLGESNPFVLFLLNEFGIRGLFALKIAVFVIAVGINLSFRKQGDWLGYYGPPVFVALLGTLLTVSNLLAIMSA